MTITGCLNSRKTVIGLIATWLLISFSVATQARQFRSINPVASLDTPTTSLPDGAIEVASPVPLQRELVDNLVRDTLSQWNTPQMGATLAAEFYDTNRLMDSMATVAPRDAVLRVQSVQGIQTLQQYIVPEPDTRRSLVSIISATVRTQLEFEDPDLGFVRRPGVNEYILKIITAAPP